MPAIHRPSFLAMALLGIAAPSAADDFPYEAYVVVEQADVVAGPGHRFYVTDRLAWGTKVEIYREEPSGWLAIRPPEGSFSWIPGDFLERMEDDLGRITEPTGAWIGTSVEHVSQHQQHITLKSGELVQILGEKKVAAADGEERTWFKIAPPAGEYRWVYLRDVSRQKSEAPPAASVASVSREEEETVKEEAAEPQRFELAGNPIALSSIDQPRVRIDSRVAPAQYRSAAPASQPTVSSDGFVPRKRRDAGGEVMAALPASTTRSAISQPLAVATRTQPSNAHASSPSTAVESSASGLAPSEMSRQLDQIEIDLSLLIAQDRSQWNFEPIKRRVLALVDSGVDPASRGRARLVLDKIKQFEATFQVPAEPTAPRATALAASKALADPRYDAQGILKEVISRKSAKPAAPYAVVDAEGKPLCFVSPSPGLNLNRYLNKPVGLYGRRGYLEELKKPHVLAENVVELDSRWR